MDEDYSKQREELVNRFRQAIKGTLPDAWFDEDDLLDIFDYAGDNAEDYIRAEVLMWGARYFPDSERLRERRGVFYADVLTDADLQNFAADAAGANSLLTNILDLRSQRLNRDDARQKLIEIFAENNNIDDEETIQLVTFADETSNLDWMAENIEDLKERVSYKPALLYEIAAFARDHEDYNTAIKLLKMLVDEMPYNADYWNLLSSAYATIGEEDLAIEACDMTLAIDPTNAEALANKAMYYSMYDMLEPLHKLYVDNPDNETISGSYVEALLNTRNAAASKYFDRHLKKFGVKDNFVTLCAMHLPDHTYTVADAYFNDNCTDDNLNDVRIWTQWSESVASAGHLTGAIAMMEVLMAHQSKIADIIAPSVCVLAEMYFINKQWHKMLHLLSQAKCSDVHNHLPIGFMTAVAFMKLYDVQQASQVLNSYMETCIRPIINDLPAWRPEQRIANKAIVQQLWQLREFLASQSLTKDQIDSYDPFNFWG